MLTIGIRGSTLVTMAKLRVRTVKVEPEEDQYLRTRAEQEGRSVSNYIRRLIVADRADREKQQPQQGAA